MARYQVRFYMAGTRGVDPEAFETKREAEREAAAFIRSARTMAPRGIRREGSVSDARGARLVNPLGAIEAQARIVRADESTDD